jgi:hypothetical protein
VRAPIEHVFGAIAQMEGKLLRTIGQARAEFAMTQRAVRYKRVGRTRSPPAVRHVEREKHRTSPESVEIKTDVKMT